MAQFKVTNQTLLHYWDQAIAMEGDASCAMECCKP
jgi:hypothetical protein